MIIIDLNQVMISNLMMSLGNHTNSDINENMVRHMVLNAIRSFKMKFHNEYGEIIIACDNTNYWRRKEFQYYKASRKTNIEKSELDWKSIFECLGKIRAELKEFFPYRVIDIESSEADDVIGTLVHRFGNTDRIILILSGDKDFVQLHSYSNVKQYDPVKKKYISNDDPEKFLREHIIRGDVSDGVPNMLSDDDSFVNSKRQVSITKNVLNTYISMPESEILKSSVAVNYSRNKMLIDLKSIPINIVDKINKAYDEPNNKNKSKLLEYFIANKMKLLTQSIGEF